MNWTSLKNALPDNGLVVWTKIDDEKGVRNEQALKRERNLWYTPDGRMYVYYTPTHWALIEEKN